MKTTMTIERLKLQNDLRDEMIRRELWGLLRLKRSVKLFCRDFKWEIFDGHKIQTIRPARKVEHRIGELLDLRTWSGLPYRSKQIRLAWGVVDLVAPVTIHDDGFEMDGVRTSRPQDVEAFAAKLGFAGWDYAFVWYRSRYTLPWTGTLTGWHPVLLRDATEPERIAHAS